MDPTPEPSDSLWLMPNSAGGPRPGKSGLDLLDCPKASLAPLDRAEFEHALRNGLGRALMHVLRHGLGDREDLVLEACLHDQNYDHQSDPSRAPWLHRMIAGTTGFERIRSAILAALAQEDEPFSVEQLCRLAAELAVRGDEGARQSLGARARSQAATPSRADWVGADLWIEIAGATGALELARIYGRRRLRDPQRWLPGVAVLSEHNGQCLRDAVAARGSGEPELDAYAEHLNLLDLESERPGEGGTATGDSGRRDAERPRDSVEAILAQARAHTDEYPGRYTSWGRFATADERARIWNHIAAESDEGTLVRLLWVFRRAVIPGVTERVLAWAEAANPELRHAALEALSTVSDARIHALARSKARSASLAGDDLGALDLFRENYAAGDGRLIAQALRTLTSDVHHAHALVWTLVDIAERQRDPELEPALRWACGISPCMRHRWEALEQLAWIDAIDEELRRECEYDAHPEIRALALQCQAGDAPSSPGSD